MEDAEDVIKCHVTTDPFNGRDCGVILTLCDVDWAYFILSILLLIIKM